MSWTSGRAAGRGELGTGTKVRVLVIDDHVEARDSLVRLLSRDDGLEIVGTASTVDDAARILPGVCPEIVLLDIRHSDGDRVAACRALKRLTGAPVVAFMSYVTADLWSEARAAGVVDYLLKHVDSHRLGREIRRLAERHSRRHDAG